MWICWAAFRSLDRGRLYVESELHNEDYCDCCFLPYRDRYMLRPDVPSGRAVGSG
ncbi:hypothetical protein KCP73_25680 [Salmonella enterica subsp. enterica]|nr:hypothetical protein KCP73_25680 [Salmonella enterica subsp. enterica]